MTENKKNDPQSSTKNKSLVQDNVVTLKGQVNSTDHLIYLHMCVIAPQQIHNTIHIIDKIHCAYALVH